MISTISNVGTVRVCAGCYPFDSVLRVRPDLRHYRISHGLCAFHLKLFYGYTPNTPGGDEGMIVDAELQEASCVSAN